MAPPVCAACRKPVDASVTLCQRCDAALPRGVSDSTAPPPLVACVAAVEFRGVVESWIHRFKYPAAGLAALDPAPLAVARMLCLEAGARAPAQAPDLVVPVPLHPRRLRARGFNPACVLARALARERGLRLDPVALRRVRDTPSQTGLNRRARRRNVRGAFVARSRVPPRVWLVDDVVTTGSTLGEAARALQRAGARSVVAICAARTPL